MNKIILIITAISILSLISSSVEAERGGAPVVEPLVYEGVQFIAPNTPQKMGYVEARDVTTNTKVWEQKVYTVVFDRMLEQDVQWVFISSFKIEDGKLIVTDERGEEYKIDIPKDLLKENLGQSVETISIREEDIRETVFRYIFLLNESSLQQQAKVYFLSLGKNNDPSDELMERFQNSKIPVKKVSQCMQSVSGVIDKQTGEKGLIFYIVSIQWINNNEAEVEGGYFENGKSASGHTYRVAKEDKRWIVKEDRINWES